jgi:hypothetical protein
MMKTILRFNTIRLDEEIAHTLRQSSNSSRVEKRNVEAWHKVETCWYSLTLIETRDSDESNQCELMLDCRDVSRGFHQNAVSTKARRISETISSDRHHSFDQSEAISLSIEMLDWRNMLKNKWSDNDKLRWWDELMK